MSLISAELYTEFSEKFLHKEAEVLLEDKRSICGRLQGYTDRYIKVLMDGPDSLKGKFVSFKYGTADNE